MRIQFVHVPGGGIFGEPSGKVLMCVSEIKGKIEPKEFDDYMQKRLGIAGVLITDEVVRFEPAQPESDWTDEQRATVALIDRLNGKAPEPCTLGCVSAEVCGHA